MDPPRPGEERGEGGDDTKATVEGDTEDMGLAAEWKLGQVSCFRHSEAMRGGLEAENTASNGG
ncbi:putative glycine-rich RNA-binding protein GRP1A-like [Sesbania bispinosa]|nr:putative glycine-rich RNA-binding protein GRP1A-like [Sesbania bispinosa]